MDKILKKIKESFVSELIADGDQWRILRKSTFIDLIKLDFLNFQKKPNEKYLINIINNGIKIILLSRIEPIEPSSTLEKTLNRFNLESEAIILNYDQILTELKLERLPNKFDVYKLNENIQYIKVLKDLELDAFNTNTIRELVSITYNILHENF